MESFWISSDETDTAKLKRYGALGVSVFGVESWKELLLGLMGQVGCGWMAGGQGPSCIYSALAGIHLQKKRWLYAGVPLAVNVSDYSLPAQSQVAHVSSFVIGYLFAYLKLV
jgi:hypothetical protein